MSSKIEAQLQDILDGLEKDILFADGKISDDDVRLGISFAKPKLRDLLEQAFRDGEDFCWQSI